MAVLLLVLWLPMNQVLQRIDLVQVRMLSIFTLAVLCWVLELIPNFATSVLLIGLELLLISDKGPIWLRDPSRIEEMGKLLPYQDILTTLSLRSSCFFWRLLFVDGRNKVSSGCESHLGISQTFW